MAGPGRDLDAAAQRRDLRSHHVHADAAPRDLRHAGCRREARFEDAGDDLAVGGLRVGGDPALRDRLGANVGEVEAGAVVGELDGDLVGDLPHGQRDFPGLGLARLRPPAARLDAVVERIAQQVLERADQLLEHRAVELGLPAADFEVRPLAELPRRPAHDPVQALGQAAEGHRADREQLLLHVARESPLRDQRRVRDVEVLQQRLLDGRHVVDPFAQRARELLEAGVLIELERIEPFLAFSHLHQARLDLRLGLDLDLAHLRAQAYHAAGELEQVRLQRAQLAFDARPRDRHFAGLVDEPVDDVGAHAQHRAGAGLHVGGVGVRARRRGLGRRQRHDDRPLRGRDAGAAPGTSVAAGATRLGGRERLVLFRGPGQRNVGPALAQRVENEGDPIEIAVQRLEQLGRAGHRRVVDDEARLHQVHELAQAHRPGHPRAALEGVQGPAQLARAAGIARGAAPGAHLLAGLRVELRGLLEKDRQHLRVDVVADCRPGDPAAPRGAAVRGAATGDAGCSVTGAAASSGTAPAPSRAPAFRPAPAARLGDGRCGHAPRSP